MYPLVDVDVYSKTVHVTHWPALLLLGVAFLANCTRTTKTMKPQNEASTVLFMLFSFMLES